MVVRIFRDVGKSLQAGSLKIMLVKKRFAKFLMYARFDELKYKMLQRYYEFLVLTKEIMESDIILVVFMKYFGMCVRNVYIVQSVSIFVMSEFTIGLRHISFNF